MDVLVVRGVDEDITMGEELKFFGYFLLASEEVFVVSLSDVGKNAYSGINYITKTVHFACFRDACLEDGKFVFVGHLPNGEGDADLRVVATRTGNGFAVGGDELDYPVFDNGFAIGAGDANYGNVEKIAVVGGKLLEGKDNVADEPEIGFSTLVELLDMLGRGVVGDNEITHSTIVEVADKTAASVAFGWNGKKNAAGKVGGATAVGKQLKDFKVVVDDAGLGALEDVGYFGRFQFVMILYPIWQLRQRC